MGLGNHGAGTRFVHVASGKMHFKENGEKKVADFLEGLVTGIKIEDDEFEGQVVRKVAVDMVDADATYRLSFTLNAWFSVGFFARIRSVDLSKPVKIGVMQSEKNEKVSFCWIKQGNDKIESNKDTPRPKKVEIGKGKSMKTVVDYSDFEAFAEKTVEELSKKSPAPEAEKKKPLFDESGDLPF